VGPGVTVVAATKYVPLEDMAALAEAGVERIDRFDRCTACEPDRFFSHRRDAGRTGRQGVIAYVAG
jgi:copper oxidase (laccase) domain-containing protein